MLELTAHNLWRGRLIRLAILAILVWFLLDAAARAAFYPMKYPEGWWDQQAALSAEDVIIVTSDGVRLHAWWIANQANVFGTPLVTLFLHGNAGNVTHRVGHAREILAAGSSVLIVDYRGYGKSEGSPTEAGLYADALAAYQYLVDQGVRTDQLIIHGESLGTAAAVDLAAKRPCAGLILESGFSSGPALAHTIIPYLGPALFHGYDAASKIEQVKAPLLQFHGDQDQTIDIALGRDLFAAAREPKTFVTIPGGDHNDLLPSAGPLYGRSLGAFYQQVSGQE